MSARRVHARVRVRLCSEFDRGEGAVLDKIRETSERRLLG